MTSVVANNEIPFFEVSLVFKDSSTKRTVLLHSKMCEQFLNMTPEEYIYNRDMYIKKNLNSNETPSTLKQKYKTEIAYKFKAFSGDFIAVIINSANYLQSSIVDSPVLMLVELASRKRMSSI